jgi:hypothetical protein
MRKAHRSLVSLRRAEESRRGYTARLPAGSPAISRQPGREEAWSIAAWILRSAQNDTAVRLAVTRCNFNVDVKVSTCYPEL